MVIYCWLIFPPRLGAETSWVGGVGESEERKGRRKVFPQFQIISHFNNLVESKHFKFDKNYKENYKDL